MTDPKDLPAPKNGGRIRPCVAQKSLGSDFPRSKIDPLNVEGPKTYSEGMAGEMWSLYGAEPKPMPISGVSVSNGFNLTYDIQKAFGVPDEYRQPAKQPQDCERCGCQSGCNSYVRGSMGLGPASSADLCLQRALAVPACLGMKSITWINTAAGGNCLCTGGTMLVIKSDDSGGTDVNKNNLINYEERPHSYSLTCMLPKRGETDHSTYYHANDGIPKPIPVCNAGEPKDVGIQDHSQKSILIGTFGFDVKGRAACADAAWKDKKCQSTATRLSYSKQGECRCEWGPLVSFNAVRDWKLNGANTPNEASHLLMNWRTCLMPRSLLENGGAGKMHLMWR